MEERQSPATFAADVLRNSLVRLGSINTRWYGRLSGEELTKRLQNGKEQGLQVNNTVAHENTKTWQPEQPMDWCDQIFLKQHGKFYNNSRMPLVQKSQKQNHRTGTYDSSTNTKLSKYSQWISPRDQNNSVTPGNSSCGVKEPCSLVMLGRNKGSSYGSRQTIDIFKETRRNRCSITTNDEENDFVWKPCVLSDSVC